MINYIIVHDPHSSPIVPDDQLDQFISPQDEIEIVTDWYAGELIRADETVSFPFSRILCDVERLIPDPADTRGQGMAYATTIDGRLLCEATDERLRYARALYDWHHRRLDVAIEKAISLMPVLLVDAHTFSDRQADLTGVGAPDVDVCVGFNGHEPPSAARKVFDVTAQSGLKTAFNAPFSGSFIPARYRSHPDVTSVMIEVNKKLYLRDPLRRARDPEGFAKLKVVLDKAISLLGGSTTLARSAS